MESLHKAVNPDILPREYGGKTHSVDQCISLWKQELEQNRSILLQLDQLKVAGVRSSLLCRARVAGDEDFSPRQSSPFFELSNDWSGL